MKTTSLLLGLVLATGWLCACGSDNSGANPDGGTNPDGGPNPDGSIVVPDGPITFQERILGFDNLRGFVVGAGKRVVSLSESLSSTTQAITLATLDGTKAQIATVPVTGKLPSGRIESIAYDPGADMLVMIVRAQRPHRIEVVTLKVTDTTATFATLTQSATLPPDGFMFNALHTRGGGAFVAPRGNDLQPFTIGGDTLTWQATIPASSFWQGMGVALAPAPTEGGLYAFGKSTYDPVQKKMILTPTVQKNVPVGPSFTDVAMGGTPPPVDTTNPSPTPGWSAYDATGKRLLVSAMHDVLPCPPPQTICKAPGLYIADLKTNQWSKGPEFFTTFGYTQSAWATDDAARRVFARPESVLAAMAIDEKSDWQLKPFTQEGDVGPSSVTAVAISSAGRILEWEGSTLRTFEAGNAKARWEQFGTKVVPVEVQYSDARTLAPDNATGEWLATSSRMNDPKATFDTYSIDKDGTSFTKLATTGAIPVRFSPATFVVSGTLYVIGGSTNIGSGKILDDVWALDRKTNAWKQIGTLPQPLQWATARQVTPTELWVIGWAAPVQGKDPVTAPIVSIDLVTGKTHELQAHGEPGPSRLWAVSPLGTGFVGFESGDTVDSTEPNLWTVTKDGDGVVWKKTPVDVDDYSLNGLRGVGRGDGTAYFVGKHFWQATITTK